MQRLPPLLWKDPLLQTHEVAQSLGLAQDAALHILVDAQRAGLVQRRLDKWWELTPQAFAAEHARHRPARKH